MNETKLDISTPKEELPTTGFSVIVAAPQGYPIRDNARGKVIAVCAEPSEATRIARALASQADLLEACQTFVEWLKREDEGLPKEIQRDTPEGERAWRRWFNDNMELCDRAQHQARAAIAKVTGGAA